MKLLQTYYKEFKTERLIIKEISEAVKLKAFSHALGFTFLMTLLSSLFIVNLMIFSQIQLFLAYVIVLLYIAAVFLYLELYYGAIIYFDKSNKCAKIRMLKIVYGFSTSIILFVLGHFIIRYIFGGYV